MGDLSPHFDSAEFACHHCGAVKIAGDLVEHLEQLRSLVGRPLVVVSGYRCAVHNRAVGGARKSQHLAGTAADLEFGYATVTQARVAGFVGVGMKNRWATHVDMRAGARAGWRYS